MILENFDLNKLLQLLNTQVESKHILEYAKENRPFMILMILSITLAVFILLLLFILMRRNYFTKINENKNYDSLTGARNYHKFLDDAEKLINSDSGLRYAIIESNLKNFKYVNEMFGYDEGNAVLIYLKDVIDSLLNQNEVFGRVNGDNFVILMSYHYEHDISQRLDVIRKKMLDFDRSVEANYTITFVAGIYCINDNRDTMTVKEMVERANMAQISVSSSPDDEFLFYEEQMRINILKENEIVKNMREALLNNEFHIYLQPQHYIQKNDMIFSAEALVRWVKKDGKIISPGEFIPIFEKNGFIVDLDRYIFEGVCRFIRRSLDTKAIETNLSIAVNVSKIDLYQRDFTKFYSDVKNYYNIPDGMIELEFTESTVFDDYNTFKKIMKELKMQGFKCSLDDFGAGSSSLNVLKELPVDVLKMDKLFFNTIEDEKRNNSVIASVVAMARGLDMKIIAEGIEDIEKVNFLRKIGCDIVQGFVFSKPMPMEKFPQYARTFISYDTPVFSDKYDPLTAQFDVNDNVNIKLFMSVLKFVNAFVLSIDLDSGEFRSVSTELSKLFQMPESGDYPSYLKQYTKTHVYDEDRDTLYNGCSLQAIISCFYRGDENIYIEYRAKNAFNQQCYDFYSATVMRMYTGRSKQIRALLMIKKSNSNFYNMCDNAPNSTEHKNSPLTTPPPSNVTYSTPYNAEYST